MGTGKGLDFESLVAGVHRVHKRLAAHASKAVNISLTMRNWLAGAYIAEYKLNGADRAAYGVGLLEQLAERLARLEVSNCKRHQLYRYVRFYRRYPGIAWILSPELWVLLPIGIQAVEKVGTASPQSHVPSEKLIPRLSYSHLEMRSGLEDDLKRAFYEIECLRGNWSVRELKRQIASLYYERSGLSRDKSKLAEGVRRRAEKSGPGITIRDPYVFEFLGLKPKEVMSESNVQVSLLDKLQEFLLELGRGFCLEGRHRRILIGGEHFFVDLVFYHRVLKCHVLIELKVDCFKHQYLGQLNTYVNWFRKHHMTEGDNPPIGILLCTQKNQALVEYALAGMDNRLFVSKYQLELPKEHEIRAFLEEHMRTEP